MRIRTTRYVKWTNYPYNPEATEISRKIGEIDSWWGWMIFCLIVGFAVMLSSEGSAIGLIFFLAPLIMTIVDIIRRIYLKQQLKEALKNGKSEEEIKELQRKDAERELQKIFGPSGYKYIKSEFEESKQLFHAESERNSNEASPQERSQNDSAEHRDYDLFMCEMILRLPPDLLQSLDDYGKLHADEMRKRFEIAKDQLKTTCKSPISENMFPLRDFIDLNGSEIKPKLKRAFLFLEDEEWEKADQYFEAVLDDDPTNAYAYIGKVMAEKRLTSFEALEESGVSFSDNKNYIKAVRFADKKLANKLEALSKEGKYEKRNYSIYTRCGTIWLTPKVAELVLSSFLSDDVKLNEEDNQSLQAFIKSLMLMK